MKLLTAYLRQDRTRQVLSTRPGQKGFSLIELVVVIAVLAVLTAIALPNFLGVSEDASARTAQQGLLNAFKECKVLWARNKRDNERYFAPPAITGWAISSEDSNAAFNTSRPRAQPKAGSEKVRCFDDSETSRDFYAHPLDGNKLDNSKFPSFKISADGTKACRTGNEEVNEETFNVGCATDKSKTAIEGWE